MAEEFFSLIVMQARQKRLLSDEHFTVDGTLVEVIGACFVRRASEQNVRLADFEVYVFQ